MSTLCRSALLACFTALLAAFAFASHVEAARASVASSGLDPIINRRRGGNDITRPRASGTTPPRARARSCAPSSGGSVSHLSALWTAISRGGGCSGGKRPDFDQQGEPEDDRHGRRR